MPRNVRKYLGQIMSGDLAGPRGARQVASVTSRNSAKLLEPTENARGVWAITRGGENMALRNGQSSHKPPRRKGGNEAKESGANGECTGSVGDRRVADCWVDEGLSRFLVPRKG